MLGAVKMEAISPSASILNVEMPALTHVGRDFTVGGTQHWGTINSVVAATQGTGVPLRVGGAIRIAGAAGSVIGTVDISNLAAVGFSLGPDADYSNSGGVVTSNEYAIVIETAGTIDTVELNRRHTSSPGAAMSSASATFESFVVHGGLKVATAASSGRGARVGLVQLWYALQIYGALSCPWQGASGSTGIVIVNDVLVQEPQPAGACNAHGIRDHGMCRCWYPYVGNDCLQRQDPSSSASGGAADGGAAAAVAAALQGAEQLLLGAQQQQQQQQAAATSSNATTATHVSGNDDAADDDGAGGPDSNTRVDSAGAGAGRERDNGASDDADGATVADAAQTGGSTTIVLIAGAVIVVSVICSIFLLNAKDPVEQAIIKRVTETMSHASSSTHGGSNITGNSNSNSRFGARDSPASVGYAREAPLFPTSPQEFSPNHHQLQLSPHQYHPGVGGGGSQMRFSPSSGDARAAHSMMGRPMSSPGSSSTKDSRHFAAGLGRSSPAAPSRIKSPLSPGAGDTGTHASLLSVGSGKTMTETLLKEAGLAEHNIEEFETYQLVSARGSALHHYA